MDRNEYVDERIIYLEEETEERLVLGLACGPLTEHPSNRCQFVSITINLVKSQTPKL